MLADRQQRERRPVRDGGRTVRRRPPDDRPIGLEQDRERVEQQDRPQDRELVEQVDVLEDRQAVQAGGEVEPQPQDVPGDVAEVAEEHVAGATRAAPPPG